MARYIDADALVKRLKHSPLFLGTNMQFKDGVIDLVERQPAADVVEVVRCEDCKHYKRHKPPIEDFDGWCSANEIECDTDFYCQYGSMKGGE